jgi:TrmH family RNA methyltransferase
MEPPKLITSPDNPLAKRIRLLRQRKHRLASGTFYVEGPRACLAAIQAAAPIEVMVLAPELLTSGLVRDAVETSGLPIATMSAAVFRSFSQRDNPTGVAAVVRFAERELVELPVGPRSLFVALEGVSDPGNLGTILRTMDAAEAAGLILVGAETTDPYHPTAAKASLGALFTVPIARANWEALWTWSADHGVRTVATSARAELAYWGPGAVGSPPVVLLFGGEREGLAADVQARADRCVTIPMGGTVSSLNLGVAAGLLIYEMRRGGEAAI